MSEQLVGLINENEFYAEHYLCALLAKDLKGTLDAWKQAETADQKAPPARLRGFAREFFRLRERLARERDAAERVAVHAELSCELLTRLGFTVKPTTKTLGDVLIPVLAEALREDGSPAVWCVPLPQAYGDETELFAQTLLPEQTKGEEGALYGGNVQELATAAFNLDEPPRFLVLVGEAEVALLERGKWAEQRLLRFKLEEILSRRDAATINVTASLLARESLAPSGGVALIDTLEEASHKHAHEVSEDLKFAIREVIELLGNATNDYYLHVRKESVYGAFQSDAERASELGRQCLRYAYRILFVLYLEARPELGYAPMGNGAYESGYSFERLRDLEQLELETKESEEGTYIHQCLDRLFRMIYDGCAPEAQRSMFATSGAPVSYAGASDQRELFASPQLGLFPEDEGEAEEETEESLWGTFRLPALRSHLFDPERTALLNRVKFPNRVLQRVIELLSLSRGVDAKGKRKSRGRISYATLGVNQLGAVYETLLSYRSFFAQTELYEVKRAKDKDHDVLKVAYFVSPEELKDYSEDERVRDDAGKLVVHPKGRFLYRLAGRERQTSASYYTPQSLTRTLVKYALQELLYDEEGRLTWSADELLELTICEPAMGSAAFLNEVIDQVAELYLKVRQDELGARIPHEAYAHEKQRVKMLLADNNVFGVDLNPLAIELAEVSLWLNTIHPGGFVPWFGMQLVCGNSLVGAWRKVFTAEELSAGPDGKETPWLDAVPTRVPLGQERPKGSVYHFLLPDRRMSVYGQGIEGRPIKAMCADQLSLLDERRSALCQPLDEDEIETLVELSDAVDRLWAAHIQMMQKVRVRTTDPMGVWGWEPKDPERKPTDTRFKDSVWEREVASQGVQASSPYRRLKFVMDYWCSLWFWPIEQAGLFPSRSELLLELGLLLQTDVLRQAGKHDPERPLFADTLDREEAQELLNEHGFVDVEALCAKRPRLEWVGQLGERYRFHHWELEFADLFAERGGFDLVVGNPPWIKVSWIEASVLGDLDPAFVLKGLSAVQASERRAAALERPGMHDLYLGEHEGAAGFQGFLTSQTNYPALRGIQPNLYKCFLPLSGSVSGTRGVSGFIHPEGVYDDPKGSGLRRFLYRRLRRHYQFRNELGLFQGTNDHGRLIFSLNLYGPDRAAPSFVHISNVFSPATIDTCHAHPGGGPVPGIKTDDNAWNLEGHRDRVIRVGPEELELFAKLYDEPGTPPEEARLAAVHSTQLVDVLRKFADVETTLGKLDNWFATKHMDETYAQRDGRIRRETRFPDSPEDLVLSGPHFFVGNPLYKTPRAECTQNSHYDVIDLTQIPEDYLPRTNYVRDCSVAEYRERTPKVPWGDNSPVTSQYRLVTSALVGPAGERTLQASIASQGPGHIDTVYGWGFREPATLLRVGAMWASLPADFFVKSMGVDKFRPSVAKQLPVFDSADPRAQLRMLLISCLTQQYAKLWESCFKSSYTGDGWTKADSRLEKNSFTTLSEKWAWNTPIRSDLTRRQALVELDVLAAMSLGLSLEELQGIYRAQFSVLRQNEEDTWYDQQGRIVFTCSKGLHGVGLPRSSKKGDPTPGWEDVRDMTSGTVERTILDDTLPGGPRERTIVYHAPFDRCDREQDYATAWAAFDARESAS